MHANSAYHGLRNSSVSNVKSFLLRRGKGRGCIKTIATAWPAMIEKVLAGLIFGLPDYRLAVANTDQYFYKNGF